MRKMLWLMFIQSIVLMLCGLFFSFNYEQITIESVILFIFTILQVFLIKLTSFYLFKSKEKILSKYLSKEFLSFLIVFTIWYFGKRIFI